MILSSQPIAGMDIGDGQQKQAAGERDQDGVQHRCDLYRGAALSRAIA
jgi:hypothetical protein